MIRKMTPQFKKRVNATIVRVIAALVEDNDKHINITCLLSLLVYSAQLGGSTKEQFLEDVSVFWDDMVEVKAKENASAAKHNPA